MHSLLLNCAYDWLSDFYVIIPLSTWTLYASEASKKEVEDYLLKATCTSLMLIYLRVYDQARHCDAEKTKKNIQEESPCHLEMRSKVGVSIVHLSNERMW